MTLQSKACVLLFTTFSALAMCTTASAVTVGATVDFVDQGPLGAPAPDQISIINISDPGIRIVSITIDLSTADANYLQYEDQMPHAPRWDTAPGCSAPYCYSQEADGQPLVSGPGGSGAAVGFAAPTEADLAGWDQGQTIHVSFSDFDAGESVGLLADADDSIDFRLSGREFAYATLIVTFEGAALTGGTLTLTDRFYADPANAWRAVGRVLSDVSATPVPAAAWLLGSALGLLGLRRRRA
jgi:hypothetical protein